MGAGAGAAAGAGAGRSGAGAPVLAGVAVRRWGGRGRGGASRRSETGRQIDVTAHRQPAVGAEAVFAAVDRGAAGARGDAGLAQDGDWPALLQGAFERAQLGVDVAERGQLGEHEGVVALPEAVQVEDQAAEVAVGELARLAQEAGAAARATARSEAGRLGGGGGVRRAGSRSAPASGASVGVVPDI